METNGGQRAGGGTGASLSTKGKITKQLKRIQISGMCKESYPTGW